MLSKVRNLEFFVERGRIGLSPLKSTSYHSNQSLTNQLRSAKRRLLSIHSGERPIPGLAQLVECLAHRYSESTSSNPGNLTSATVCGDRTSGDAGAKRSAHVAPEADLGECKIHSPPQKVNKAETTLALKPRGDITRNPKQGYQWPQKRTCLSAANVLKKEVKIY